MQASTRREAGSDDDAVFMDASDLREVVVESRRHKMLHMLAYVREYSTMSTYTDTVFMFREKMVDYMLPPDRKTRFRGWRNPRVLTSRSYYRFTDAHGLDSVSDVSNHHFSWSDWVGVADATGMPSSLRGSVCASDTARGKYSPAEIWVRENDRVSVCVDVLADTIGRRWVPELSGFFSSGLDFERFRMRYEYDNVTGDSIIPADLTGYTMDIESRGRGRSMFMFNRIGETVYTTTHAEVYLMHREYITVKDAKKWQRQTYDSDEIGIFEPSEVPALEPPILALIDRISNMDRDRIRVSIEPDHRLVSNNLDGRNFKFGRRALNLLKEFTGITLYKSRKNFKRRWKSFRKEQVDKRQRQAVDE